MWSVRGCPESSRLCSDSRHLLNPRRVNIEIQTAEREYDLQRASELKYGTLRSLQQSLQEVQAKIEAGKASPNRMLR